MVISRKRVYNWYISMVAASCMVLYGYDASVYNSVQGSDNWIAWFDNPDDNRIGVINTAYTVGAILSGMAAGCFLVAISTFVQTFAPRHNLGAFIGGRTILGFGQGLALTAGPVYIGELAPAEIRGKIMTFWQLFYSVGSFICFWVNYACTAHKERLGEWDWKMVVMFQLLVPVLVLCLLWSIPETPRWYIKRHDDTDAARRTLLRVRDNAEDIENEILEIRKALEFEKEAISSSYSALWKDKSVRKRLLLAFVLNAGQQITGQGSLNSYSTAIYKKVFKSSSKIALINALNATFGIIFTLNAAWTVDRFGRKFLLIIGGIGMGLCMIIVATVETQTPVHDGSKSSDVAISIVFLLFLFIFFYKPSWGATVWIISAEMFSMNVRAQAVGMASQTQNIANAIVQQFFPIFLNNCGFYAFYMFAGINFLLATFVYFFIPETKKVHFEEVDTLFGGANHVNKGAEMLGVTEQMEKSKNMGTSITIEGGEGRK
ncbi:putative sugar transporter [Phaeomoniella chlamydospora]|uniref:Putative sugar transporter n=1 Tax=Phaeomoniella chlamydospora TaxID=158046 RepID=A0A0G2GC86_PHACM|nr:putative sugar transporter [Phaeomoniella chlamydospora]